jgi:phosphate transport system substrate-binding protein
MPARVGINGFGRLGLCWCPWRASCRLICLGTQAIPLIVELAEAELTSRQIEKTDCNESLLSAPGILVRTEKLVKRNPLLKMPLVVVLLSLRSSMPIASAQVDRLMLSGDGSTFAYPMYSKWIEEYEKDNPAVHLNYVSNGSGAGIHDIMMGTVDFAGTDGPLNKTQMLDLSAHRNCEVLHFPVAIGADVPIYNVPGVIQELNFSPQALAGIFLGTITKWNDHQIAKVNPDVSLPNNDIVVVHRQDSSGTTYIWTDYLTKVSEDWRQRVGTGIMVEWPVGIAGKGNEGVVQLVAHTPYSIAYAELTYAVHNRLFYGRVANQSSRFIKAELASVTAAAAGVSDRMPADFRVSITNAPGEDAYPISSFTWMLLPSIIADSAKRREIIKFLQWGLTKGQAYLEPLSYARLPSATIVMEKKAIAKIKSSSTARRQPNTSISDTGRHAVNEVRELLPKVVDVMRA